MIKTKPAIITITPASILTDCPLMQINQSLLSPPNASNRALKGSKRRHTFSPPMSGKKSGSQSP